MEKKAIIYIHVTDEDEQNGHDLYFQMNACSEFAKIQGFTIHDHIYIDDSRKKEVTLNQPRFMFAPLGRDNKELSCALQCMKHSNDHIEYLLIYNSSVLPRNEKIRKIMFADLDFDGKKVISVTEGIIKIKISLLFKVLRFIFTPEGWYGPEHDPFYP